MGDRRARWYGNNLAKNEVSDVVREYARNRTPTCKLMNQAGLVSLIDEGDKEKVGGYLTQWYVSFHTVVMANITGMARGSHTKLLVLFR